MKKLTLFLVAMLFSTLSFAAQPKRIYAYGLSATLNGNVYTFSFSANETPTSGRMLFYDATTSELVGEIALTSPVLGVNNVQISVDELPGIHNQQLNWAVELSAAKVTAYEKIYADASHKYRRGHSNVDVSPESDHFGAVYVGDRVKTTANGKFYVYSPTYAIKDANGYSLGSSAWGFSRFDVAPDGKVWLSDFSDAHSGLWIVDPSDLTTATQFFVGDRQTSGLIKNGDVETGSSLSCATLYGKGANTKLITVGEDYKNYSFPVTVFNIGQTDGSLATSWSTAPNKMFNTLGNAAQNFEAKACEKGVWVSTNRGTGANNSSATSLRFYTWDGACTWSSHEHTDVINGNLGAGFEITPDEKQLIMKVADKIITIFDITWDGSTPTLTKKTSFDCGFAAVSTINLDYAGNIVTVAGTAWGSTDDKRMSLVVYSNPTDNNTCEVPAKKASVVTKKVLHTLTSFSNDEAKGTVSGAGTYIEGTTATLTATPATGYKLLYWSDRSTTNPRTITMNKNEAISAYFVKVYDQEPTFTITKVWENTNVPATTGDGFQAVGWDGNIYMQNKTAGKIQVFSNGTNAATDYATSNTSGQQIAVDEAGNMIVFNAYFATGTPNAIQIFKKGSTTAKAVTFTLKDPARCDFFSASGDIYSASGGYVYFYCAGRTVINRLKITNGAATAADVTTDVVGEAVYSSPQNTNYVMVDIFGNLVAHARSNAINAINVYTNESKAFTLPSIKMGTLGGCSFELGGKELWAYHAGASNYSSEWNIYNMTDSKFLSDDDFYAVDKEATTNYACNWLNVQVVDEYTAYIYQFCPKKAVALWKVTMQAGKATYTVTANATNGSVTGAGTYEEGATATLTATPAEHYRFVNWTYDSETSTDNPLSLVVNSDITVTANFEPVQYTLIAPTNDENKGTVTGAGTYAHGTEVTLTANPAAGYKLLYWSDRSTDNPRTITMTKNEAISAYFVKEYSEEPIFTIEKVWENTNVPASTGNGYQAVGWDGKIYMQDAGHSKIITFSDEADTGTEYATSGAGQQIAVDEAGNLIVFNATFYDANPNSILIYKKGNTTGKPISFTLPQPERCDFFSASGDIYSAEGGYVYFYCKTKQVVNRVKIANGELVSVDVVGNNITAGNTQNHVMLDIFGNLVAHSRSAVINATINVHTSESMAFTLQNHKYSTLGGCTFELGGKEFWAYNVGTTNYTSEWNIYNMTDKKFCSDDVLYAKDKTSTNTAANWLNVQVVDENTAYIYQFCPKVGAAVWEVKMLSGNLHTVTVVADNGTVTGNAGTYEDGATATLTAKANTGYKFINWTKEGTVVSTDATYTFTVTEDVTLVANFEALPKYTITANPNDVNMGSVTGGGEYYEGEEVKLTASAIGGYVFTGWSDGNTDNPRTIQVTADATYTANFKVAIARVFAYNLDMIDNGDSYTFSFIPNANAISGRLIVYNDSKAQVLAQPITSSIVKGVKNEVTISKTSLPAKGTWAIELTGEPVESLTLLTKANDKTNYGFNRPQGVAIDNSPESDFFGRIYIALPKAGGTGYSDTNYGIVVMDPQHNRLKSGVVANGDAWGDNGRYSMHRVAVNPVNGHVYYVRTSDSNEGVTGTAIYELTPDATNILTDGGTAKNVISGISEITNANSVCFDETGAMYVMANANYTNEEGSTGRVYKVTNGSATLFTPSSIELASKANSIVPDGKGGFWAAQHRNNFDTFSHLMHITASGSVDYAIDKNSANANLLPVQTFTSSGNTYTNASYRGQVAYYSIDDNNGILAYGGGAKVSVFKVSYDGAGKPSLTAWQTISLFTESTTAAVNVDGLAFDYAGNLVVMSATDERMYQYALPTNNNTSIVPAKSSLAIGEVNKITYELNGGVWNEYGWTSKKDMYNAFIADWKAYSGSTRATKTYEEQYGIGKSNNGIPVTIQDEEDILGFMAQEKWEWLGQFLDALAIAQGKETMPTTAVKQMRFGLGNFFGEDNNQTGWLGAVDCSGNIASLSAFAPYWGQTFPMPTQPTEEVVLNAPYKEGYLFEGWYATSTFTGAEVLTVDENTNGTLYAKWLEHRYTRDVTNGRYGTICLPYGSNKLRGAIFYEVAWMNTAVSPWKVYVDEVTELEAGKPYIFKATSSQIVVAYKGEEVLSAGDYKGLYGTFDNIIDGPAGTVGNVLENNHMLSNNQIMKCLGNCQLPANRAYFKLGEIPTTEPTLMPGRRRVALGVQGENEATGFDNLTEDGVSNIEGTYDVLGRKFTEPTETGFYIVNGKKVVIVK